MIECTEQLTERVCELLMNGESMRAIGQMEGLPSRSTLLRWLHNNPEFEAKCARAWEIQAHTMADMILDTANACEEDNVQSSKVKISAFQWRAEKLSPKKFGRYERVDSNNVHDFGDLTEEQIKAKFSALMAKQ